MNTKEKIEKWIEETLGTKEEIVLVHPKFINQGDFSFIANNEKLEEYFDKLEKNKISEVSKIEFIKPRFINIFLSKEFFENSIEKVLGKKEKFGKTSLLEGQKIIIEYTNTNVLKPLHIGHLMGNVIGQSVSNILESNGAEVKRSTYQGDIGLHVAKAVWGILNGADEDPYSFGSNKYDEDKGAKEEIIVINKKIYDGDDPEINHVYDIGVKKSLDHFEELYKKLNTKFDYYFFESEVSEDALRIAKEFLYKGVFEESEGAIVFKGEKYDPKLHTRVFVSSQGIPMYEAKDIAHAFRKEEKYKSNKSIIITANEQDGYFNVVLKALEQIKPEISNKTKHLSHGILKLSDGKMSSRKGNVITGESLIIKVENLVREKIKDRELNDKEKEEIAEVVAIGAIKYSILRQAVGGDIVFDFDKSISFEGDSGPYLQYAYVRAKSVLERAESLELRVKSLSPDNWEITEVEKILYRFPEVVERAGKEYSPHYLVTYLTELAGVFNSFYANSKIVDPSDPTSPYKLAITEAVSIVLQNGLNLLGIKTVERM